VEDDTLELNKEEKETLESWSQLSKEEINQYLAVAMDHPRTKMVAQLLFTAPYCRLSNEELKERIDLLDKLDIDKCDTLTNDELKLGKEELLERTCLLDMMAELRFDELEEDEERGIELTKDIIERTKQTIGISGMPLAGLYELTNEQLKEKINEEVQRRIWELRTGDTTPEPHGGTTQ
jgi:hypothetical protein